MRIGIDRMLQELKRLNPRKSFYVEEGYQYQGSQVIYGDCSLKKLRIPEGYHTEGRRDAKDEFFIATIDEKGVKEQFLYCRIQSVSFKVRASLIKVQ